MILVSLVLGIGNVLMGDDGVGVTVINRLAERYQFSPAVTILDGGTLGLDLLPRLEGVDRLLIIDAVNTDRPPGSIVRLVGEELPVAFRTKLSPHQMGLQDLLAVASLIGDLPETMVLLGVQPEDLSLGLELSATVAAQVGTLETMALEQLRCWGIYSEEVPEPCAIKSPEDEELVGTHFPLT